MAAAPPQTSSRTFGWVVVAVAGLVAWAQSTGQLAGLFLNSPAGGNGATIDGLPFPANIKIGGARQEFVGGGTRIKYGVAKVYAIGVYLGLEQASGALREFQGLEAGALSKRTAFFDKVKGGRFAKSLMLRFHRGVTGDAIVEALREAISTRLSPSATETFGKALRKMLGSAMEQGIPKGSQLFFSCRGGSLHMANGAPTAPLTSVHDEKTCVALFDVYLGKAPVSPAAKEGFAKGYARLHAK